MKRLMSIICFMSLFSTNTLANFEEVHSMNQGSCWYKEGDSSVKVTSFPANVAVELNDNYLSKLSSLNLPVSFEESFKSQLFCSTHGVSLVMNVVENSKRYCLWFGLKNEGPEVQSIGLTDYENNCDGYRPGVLVVTASSEKETDELVKSLKRMNKFKLIEKVSNKVLKVTLEKENWGEEDNIAKDLEMIKEVKFAEKSYFYHPIGEWAELDSLKRN